MSEGDSIPEVLWGVIILKEFCIDFNISEGSKWGDPGSDIIWQSLSRRERSMVFSMKEIIQDNIKLKEVIQEKDKDNIKLKEVIQEKDNRLREVIKEKDIQSMLLKVFEYLGYSNSVLTSGTADCTEINATVLNDYIDDKVSDTVINNVWDMWHDKGYTLPKPSRDAEKVYQVYIQALLDFLVHNVPNCPWRAMREAPFHYRFGKVAKIPDHILLCNSELFPAATAQMIPIENKRCGARPKVTSFKRNAHAQAVGYGLCCLLQRIQTLEEPTAVFATVVACNLDEIEVMRISVTAPNKLSIHSTGWLPFCPLNDSIGTPTEGFKWLVRLLNTEPSAVASPSQMTTKVISDGREISLQRSLGVGGTCVSYLCVWDIPRQLAVVKALRHRDVENKHELSNEVSRLRALEGARNVPRLIADGSTASPPFVAISPVGLPLHYYMQSRFYDDVQADVDVEEDEEETEAKAGGDVEAEQDAERAAEVEEEGRTGSESNLVALHAVKTSRRTVPKTSIYDRQVNETKEALRKAVESALASADALSLPSGSSFEPPSPSLSDPTHNLPSAQRAKVSVRIIEGVSEALYCAWGLNIVHSDVRPHNIVMVPSQEGAQDSVESFSLAVTDLNASFHSMLIDWASSRNRNETPANVTGMAAFQSDELLNYVRKMHPTGTSDCSIRWQLSFHGKIFKLQAMEDAVALGHTLVALLHGGPALVVPWFAASPTDVVRERSEWYMAHEQASPACPCLAFCRALYQEDSGLRASKKAKQITK
jgi:serine/threonine protein kinase